MGKYDFAVIGGDRRTACMADMLSDKGYKVIRCDEISDALSSSPVIIGGIPFADGGKVTPNITLSELKRHMRRRQKIFAGIIPDDFRRTCEEREISCYDFMLDEPMTIQNAVATAEGAILEALGGKNTTLHQSEALVLGFGRCGKMIADRLCGFHAAVTVASNDTNELSLAKAFGFDTLSLVALPHVIDKFEYIFNTIPFQVLDDKLLKKLTPDTLIIDIASNKTGADYIAAAKYGTNILYCPGLPGKYSPKSSAELLTNYVINRI
jgi:dipicolinate synthase subunit A